MPRKVKKAKMTTSANIPMPDPLKDRLVNRARRMPIPMTPAALGRHLIETGLDQIEQSQQHAAAR